MKKKWVHEYNPKTGSFDKVSKKKSKEDGEYNSETGSFEKESKIKKIKKTASKPLRKKKPKIKVKKNLKKNKKHKKLSKNLKKIKRSENPLIHLYGQEYDRYDYINRFLPEIEKNINNNLKNTEFGNYKFKFTAKTEGKYWNSKSIYPRSRNEFIDKFFNKREPRGLEGLWNLEGWGLIGVVKEKSYYQTYNINVVRPKDKMIKGGFDSFLEGLFGEPSEAQNINYSDCNGTRDSAWIPTSKKNKFNYVGRGIWLVPTEDGLYTWANAEEKATMTVIGDGLISVLPPVGNEEPKAQRIWPQKVQEDEITSKGGVKGPMSGTGFFVDNKGHIITNYHVVAPCDNKQKIIYNNKELSTKLIAKDKHLDLALLRVNVNNKHFIKITNKPIRKLQPIIAAGYPGGKALSDDLKFTSGIISSLKGIDDNSSQIQIDAALNLGNSGGPIVDNRSGELVGVAVSILRNEIVEGINFGIKVSQVRDFLYANKIDTKKISKKYKGKNLNTILENSTLYVFCK